MDKRCTRYQSFLILLALASGASTLSAAEFVVDNPLDLIDISPGDGVCDVGPAVPGQRCTLRAAVMEAEANGEADTIRINEGLTINLSLTGEGGSEVGDLEISSEIEIVGFAGAEPPLNPALLPTINAESLNDRHFEVTNGQLTLRGLRLIRGSSSTTGGSIRASVVGTSSITVDHVVFSQNFASISGGAISVSGRSDLEISDSQFQFNNAGEGGATGGGGAIVVSGSEWDPGQTVIRRSSFLDNRSTNAGSTIRVSGYGQLQIENSTLDGTLYSAPEPGNNGLVGIQTEDESTLVVRNVTITNFAESAVELRDLDGNESVLITNSILQPDADDPLLVGCAASGTNLVAANVEIGYSIVQDSPACSDFFGFNVSTDAAEIGPLTDDALPRLTVSRRPIGPLSNVVDTGADIDFIPGGPQFACTSEDQIGTARIIDGNLDGSLRCDIGAIEQLPPEPFVVNHFSDDLTDDLPGDGECATIDAPGIGVVCTLRAAIMEANASPGLAQIVFEPSDEAVVLTLPDSGAVGGALEITDTVAIDGNLVDGRPATIVQGQMPNERLFLVDAPNLLVHFRNLRMTGGDATGGLGGAIAVLADSDVYIGRSELADNFAEGSGGAVAVLGGALRVADSDFDANLSGTGAMALYGNAAARLEINGSSFRNHLGFDPGGSPGPTIDIDPNVVLVLTNSTFSGNQFGIRADEPARMTLWHLTLFDQLSGGLEIELNASSAFTLYNAIVAAPGSAQDDCVFVGDDIADSFQLAGLLDSDASCAALAIKGITADPGLQPLTRPPGQISFHHAPRAESADPSPALDVDLFRCLLQRDQYGQRRPVDLDYVPNVVGPCDLGAIEVQAPDMLFNDAFE